MRWRQSALGIPALWVGFCLATPVQAVPVDTTKLRPFLGQAEQHEQRLEWEQAAAIYEALFQLERPTAETRQRYIHALRRTWQVRRHRDASFRKEVLSLEYPQALRLFGVIQETLLEQSVDRKSTEPAMLLQKGVEELGHALADPNFCQQYLPSIRQGADARAFREYLQKTWGNVSGLTRSQVQKQVREIAMAAQSRLQLSGTITVMELACGACYAFDEYTVYLSPSQLRELYDSLKGEFVGVGLTLGAQNNKLIIADITPMSPAAQVMPALAKEDQIVSIDKKAVADLSPEAALDLLEGPLGSTVEVEIYTPGMGMRTVSLVRRALFMPSVSFHMRSEAIGYLHIACFQDTTLQEVDDALVALGKNGMKVLMLDLRGNTGGLFEVAVEVARRFLANGIVVSTQTHDSRLATIYQARNPGALGVPLVVMVDADTASSAEVLAGALKDNKRGRLMGQTTFGKGCTQSILKLPAGPGGIPTGGLRVTVARFFSPEGLAYSGRGVAPHMFVDRFLMPGMMNEMQDHQIEEAIIEAQRLVGAN